MAEFKNSDESSNAVFVQIDVHHRPCSQLNASIATTNNVRVNEFQATSDRSSIHRGYPKTDAERAQEYRARKKAKFQSADSTIAECKNSEEFSNEIIAQVTSDLSSIHRDSSKKAAERIQKYRARKNKENPIVNHRNSTKSDAERAQEYRTRNKAKIQERTSQSLNLVEIKLIQQLENENNHLAYTDFHRHHLAHDEFQKKFVRNSFGHVCSVCERLWFKDDLRSASLQHYTILKTIVPHLEIKDVFLCNTCVASLNNNSIPMMASYNGFKFPKKPDYLPPLDLVSERLVSPRIPFMQIRRLKDVNGLYGILVK
ncbi:ATP-dependent DNA helicase [Trichonephila clavipes]|nr:ATP-dependent DNA helicase [Trichonephila clavipes]